MVNRRKTRSEMVRVSAAVMGIEFAYAAETAFVSPTLLGIGIAHKKMTMIWCLSPMIGFFLTPLLGSFSDRCKSRLGRRRPFIILLSIGIILGASLSRLWPSVQVRPTVGSRAANQRLPRLNRKLMQMICKLGRGSSSNVGSAATAVEFHGDAVIGSWW